MTFSLTRCNCICSWDLVVCGLFSQGFVVILKKLTNTCPIFICIICTFISVIKTRIIILLNICVVYMSTWGQNNVFMDKSWLTSSAIGHLVTSQKDLHSTFKIGHIPTDGLENSRFEGSNCTLPVEYARGMNRWSHDGSHFSLKYHSIVTVIDRCTYILETV